VRHLCLLFLLACAQAGKSDDTTDDAATADASDAGSSDRQMTPDMGMGCPKCGTTSCIDFMGDPQNCGKCMNSCMDKCCMGTCIDTTTDNQNCGACGVMCPNAQSCCGASGCVDTNSDTKNCGACGSVCNGTCMNGSCKVKCQVDLGSCAHSPCVTGSGLVPNCDPDGVVDLICNYLDATCCQNWTSTCVQYAGLLGENCGGC